MGKENLGDQNKDKSKKVSENMKKLSKGSSKKKRSVNMLLVFLVINLLMFAACLYFLYVLPQQARDLKQAKDEALRIQESSKVDVTGLEIVQNKQNWEKLQAYFPDEVGVIKFITDLESLKKNETIKDMSFVSQNAVKDKTGSSGIPFIMEIEGSWEKVNTALKEFYKLPYLVRVINIDVTTLDGDIVNFKYGGFIYVSEALSKN
jgi:Tfp pilus assembly protein PilO